MNSRKKKPAAQTPEGRARDEQTKFIQQTVTKVENNYATLCGQMGSVNRRNSRLRDKFDEMAKTLINYANSETGPIKSSLTQFAEHISAVQDYRQALIDRMDGKVIQPLNGYKTACKHTKTDLNTTLKSRSREIKQHQNLNTLRDKQPSDRQSITRAETELQRATVDVERSTKALEETIDKFESKRVADIKKVLTEFAQIEMLFHAKALERYTLCMQDLQNFSLEDHIAMFRNSLRPTATQQRLDVVRQAAGLTLDEGHLQGPAGDIYATPQRRPHTGSALLQSATISEPNDQDQSQVHWEDENGEEYETDEDADYTEGEDSEEYEEEEYTGTPQSPQRQQQRLKPW